MMLQIIHPLLLTLCAKYMLIFWFLFPISM